MNALKINTKGSAAYMHEIIYCGSNLNYTPSCAHLRNAKNLIPIL